MALVSLDPSFSNTGIAILHCDLLILDEISKPKGIKVQKFADIQIYIRNSFMPRFDAILEEFGGTKSCEVLTEIPFPFGQFSSGLHCLDTAICQHCNVFQMFNPSLLAKIHGKKKHTKQDSVALGWKIIEAFREQGKRIVFRSNGIETKRKPSNDSMEALIYLDYFLKGIDKNNATH